MDDPAPFVTGETAPSKKLLAAYAELHAVLYEMGVKAVDFSVFASQFEAYEGYDYWAWIRAQAGSSEVETALSRYLRRQGILPYPLVSSNPTSQAVGHFCTELLPYYYRGGMEVFESYGWMPLAMLGPLLVVAHSAPTMTEFYKIPSDLLLPVWVSHDEYVQLRNAVLSQMKLVFDPQIHESVFPYLSFKDYVAQPDSKEMASRLVSRTAEERLYEKGLSWSMEHAGVPQAEQGLIRSVLSLDILDMSLLPAGFRLAISYLVNPHLVVSPENYRVDDEVFQLVPRTVLQRQKTVPICRLGKVLYLAVPDMEDDGILDAVSGVLEDNLEIVKVEVEGSTIVSLLDAKVASSVFTGASEQKATAFDPSKMAFVAQSDEYALFNPRDLNATGESVARWLFWESARRKASDIHVELDHNQMHVRLSEDGTGYTLIDLRPEFHWAFVNIVRAWTKTMAVDGRDHDEGRFSFAASGRQVDVRVSLLYARKEYPKLTLRLLDKGLGVRRLSDLRLPPHYLSVLKKAFTSRQGLVLVSGPTGSGKSTTLYSILNELNVPGKFLYTIEDPVEYEINGLTQIQVDPKAAPGGKDSFADILKRLLRADPDVILVGEIRDPQTAAAAVQAALTGHLVLATIHGNSSVRLIRRILSMELDSVTLADSLILCQAQRLLRCLCTCKLPVALKGPHCEVFARHDVLTEGHKVIYHPRGCPRCKFSGYKDRVNVMELLEIDRVMKSLIGEEASSQKMQDHAQTVPGYSSVYQQGLERVLQGITSVDEVESVCAGSH
jgi:type II secretory ATPase GspE/PulE/Tfp pilus assembly ATPase PilB-like protein